MTSDRVQSSSEGFEGANRLDRRAFLGRVAALGLGIGASGLAAACGAPAAPSAAPTQAQGSTQASAAAYKWKGVGNSRSYVQFSLLWEWLAQELPKRSNGKVTLDLTSLVELGLTGFEQIRVLKSGLIDLGEVSSAYVSGDLPVMEGVELPGLFGYDDLAASVRAHLAWQEVYKKYQDQVGAVYLGAFGWPHTVLFSRKPIRTIDDFKGMKIRSYAASLSDYFQGLGATAVTIAAAETYSALERGVIDAAPTGTLSGVGTKWYEVAKYLVDIKIGFTMVGLMMSQQTWKKLDPDTQKLMTTLGDEWTKRGMEMPLTQSKEGVDKLIAVGMEWTPFRPEWDKPVKDVFQKVVAPAWLKRSGADAQGLFNQYVAPHTGMTI